MAYAQQPNLFPTLAELAPFLGEKWIVARKTQKMLARYPGHKFVTPAKFRKIQEMALAARKA